MPITIVPAKKAAPARSFAAIPPELLQGEGAPAKAAAFLLEQLVAAKPDAIPRMGDANGLFWAFFQATQISGNLLPAVLLNQGASNTAVFLVYLGFAICGTFVSSMLRTPAAAEAD